MIKRMITETEINKTPKGIVAVLVGPDGRELANVSNFGGGGPAGISQRERQESRACRSLALAAMSALASNILSAAISSYMAEQILCEMCQKGCRILIVPIGYDD